MVRAIIAQIKHSQVFDAILQTVKYCKPVMGYSSFSQSVLLKMDQLWNGHRAPMNPEVSLQCQGGNTLNTSGPLYTRLHEGQIERAASGLL